MGGEGVLAHIDCFKMTEIMNKHKEILDKMNKSMFISDKTTGVCGSRK